VSRAAVFCGLLRCGREATACEFCVAVGPRDELRYSITGDGDRRLTRHPLRSPVAHWTPDSHRRERRRAYGVELLRELARDSVARRTRGEAAERRAV